MNRMHKVDVVPDVVSDVKPEVDIENVYRHSLYAPPDSSAI
jgi:hypothetical protein